MPDVEIGAVEGGSTSLRGYLAVPHTPGPWPGVVAIQEALGVNDILRRQADRLAAAGYLTLAPDLYSDGGMARCVMGTFRALLAQRGKPFADIDAAAAVLRGRDDCTGKVGVIGFCMGGAFALVAATSDFDAAAVNYGFLPRNPERALAGACPIVASYGHRDLSQRGAANKLARTLADLGIEHDVKEYPNAGHSFLNDAYYGPRPTHRLQRITGFAPEPKSAVDAWNRIEAFFAAHLQQA